MSQNNAERFAKGLVYAPIIRRTALVMGAVGGATAALLYQHGSELPPPIATVYAHMPLPLLSGLVLGGAAGRIGGGLAANVIVHALFTEGLSFDDVASHYKRFVGLDRNPHPQEALNEEGRARVRAMVELHRYRFAYETSSITKITS
jgi:hypothetical protein